MESHGLVKVVVSSILLVLASQNPATLVLLRALALICPPFCVTKSDMSRSWIYCICIPFEAHLCPSKHRLFTFSLVLEAASSQTLQPFAAHPATMS